MVFSLIKEPIIYYQVLHFIELVPLGKKTFTYLIMGSVFDLH